MFFWVQLRGPPLKLYSTNNARNLASNIGEVLDVEDPEECM